MPTKVQMFSEVTGSMPDFKIGNAGWAKVGQVVEGSIKDNILSQRQIDGDRIKVNAPSTRARKRKKGRPQLSLVDAKKRLISKAGWFSTVITNGVRVSPAFPNIVRWVQQKGYTGWIGPGKKGVSAIKGIFFQLYNKSIDKRRKRQKII